MTRTGLAILLVAAAVALAVACGNSTNDGAGGGGATTESTGSDAAAQSESPAADAAPSQPEKAKRTCKLRKRRPIPGALPAPPSVDAPPENAEKSDSGLAWLVLKKGRGSARPGPYDIVKVDYTGWTVDGQMFDSSVVKGKVLETRLTNVVKGWQEGVQSMRKGEKRRFWIPQELAYQGRPNRPCGMLVFDIELHSIQKAPPLPPVPDDVAGPPEGADKTESGIAWRVLRKGRGSKTPGPTSKVKIAFTGWETDGRLFRSTILEGRPSIMPLDRISSKGLSEALQLMTKGEKRRYWIPAELAYKGSPNGPQGMIVMDIEMLSFQ